VNQFLNKETGQGMVNVSVVPPELTNSIGESNSEKLSLGIFPNPSEGFFNISFDKEINLANISVYDVVGKQINITKFEREGERYKIVLEDLPSGVYIIRIQSGQSLLRSKVIISK
jgi:hypothetical protein